MKPRERCPFPEDDFMQSFPWRQLSPEEYAARHAHEYGEFSMDDYSYADPAFEHWICRFGRIVRDVDLMDECRRKYLSEEDRLKIEQYLDDVISGKIEY